MTVSPVLESEERLADVRDVAASGNLEDLEDLPSIASQASERRWGALTLVGDDRQRTLAQVGDRLPDELDVDQGFCPHAIGQPDEVFVVEDARADDVFRDNPLVQGEDGIRFYAGAPVRGPRGHSVGTVCVLDTEPGRLEEEHEAVLQRLAKLASVHLSLQAKARRVEAANEDLEQFAAFVSHELREPLSQTAMNLELISDRVPAEDWILRDLVEEALQGARRMDRLTGDLFEYTRAAEGSIESTTVDLDEVGRDVLESLEALAIDRGASVELGGLGTVHADPSLVRQVLRNLVENALHHSGPHPEIRVDVRREDDRDRVLVRDEGDGIPPEDHEHLFEMFERGSAAGTEESTGVGLAFCKRVIERHGGQIGVDSTPGEGATFWFTLPRPDA